MRVACVLVAAAAVALVPSAVLAQAVGGEFPVNTVTSDRQDAASVARRPDGSFVVVWASNYQDGSGWGVFGQRFSSTGVKVGGEFQVNNLTASWQRNPDVSIAPDGSFVVVWESLAHVNSRDVAARRFGSDGVAIAGEFRVNSYVTGRQWYPAVAHDPDGNFIVAWRDTPDAEGRYGLFGQRYDSTGSALGGEFVAFENAPQYGLTADIAIGPTGGFVMVGDAFNDAGSGPMSLGVAARRFDNAGVALGDPFVVSTTTSGNEQQPSVAMDSTGDFVVAWVGNGPGSARDIFARRFEADGDPLTDEFRVNAATLGDQILPSVARDTDGSFLVAWSDQATNDVLAQRFDTAGAAAGGPFRVNTYTTNLQQHPNVASDGSGGFVVAWESYRQEGSYSNFGVFGQRYFFAPPPRDFGDAPDPAYPTLIANSGASHVVGALFLGATVDADPDGQPDGTATGDDADEGDDEDGVSLAGPLQTGLPVGVTVTASQAGLLDAWVDWNQDGDWNDLDEQVFANEALASGSNSLSITAPSGAPTGASFARFRLSSAGGLAPGGAAPDGEVEDHAVTTEAGISELTVDDVSVSEAAGTATFTVTLAPASASTVTVKYKTANGTASSPGDYTAKPLTTLTFTPGETSKPVVVTIANDVLDEADETFFVNLTVPTNATIADAQGIGTIEDDDASPSLSINDASLTEGDSGTKTMTFTLTLAPASGRSVSVSAATGGAGAGFATAPADYTTKTQTLAFSAGQTSKTFSVAIKGDAASEVDEIFNVSLSNAPNATITDAEGVGTIVDNDSLVGVPSLSIDSVGVVEGNAGTVDAVFTVSLSDAGTQPITVHYATKNGNATSGASKDYLAKSGDLTFPVGGSLSQTVIVKVNGDALDEADETFQVNLTNPLHATLDDGQGIGTIQDDDSPPEVSIGDASVTEGDSGTQSMVFTLTLSPASGQAVTAAYSTAAAGSGAGFATSGTDYKAKAGNVTFSAGQTSKTVSVTIKSDLAYEGTEVFHVNLGVVTNASVDDGQGVGTINDNEAPPAASVVPTSGIGGTPFTITDPQGRMLTTDVCILYTEGSDPANGTLVPDAAISTDGRTLTGTVPTVAPGSYLLTVRPSESEAPRFPDLPFDVDL